MTKPRSIRIQFYVLVPLIFAGFTALAAQLTYQLMRSGAVAGGRVWTLWVAAGLLVATAFLCGLFILWMVFRPVETFLRETRALLPAPPAPPPRRRRSDFEDAVPIARTLNCWRCWATNAYLTLHPWRNTRWLFLGCRAPR